MTLREAQDLFAVWDEHPPTNILVKAILEGFGGGKKPKETEAENIPPEAHEQMQRSAIAAIAQRAGNRLPIMQGRDKGLPQKAPVFDISEMKRINDEAKANIAKRGKRNVG